MEDEYGEEIAGEYDDEQIVEESFGAAETQPPDKDDVPPEVRRHLKRQSSRIARLQNELQLARLVADYGPELVSRIPEGVDPSAVEPLLQALRDQQPATPTEGAPETVVDTPTVEEQRLANIASGPTPGTGYIPGYSDEEAMTLAITDPVRYAHLRDAGLLKLKKVEDMWGESR